MTVGFAQAGNFEVWHDSNAKSNVVTAVVSFSGDGSTQDAQADIAYPADWKLLKASAKVAGTICVGHANAKMIRVVPPSGAGTALSSKATDYCSFSFSKGKAASNVGSSEFKISFVECQAADGSKACGSEFNSVE